MFVDRGKEIRFINTEAVVGQLPAGNSCQLVVIFREDYR